MQTNILDWLEATAARTPQRIAVGDAQQDYTWAQLAENARRAGSFLAGHTAPRCPVAFYLEKSAPVFAAMLGTVYAGCCYSVLDTRQPAARTQQVLNTMQTPPQRSAVPAAFTCWRICSWQRNSLRCWLPAVRRLWM